MEPKMANRRENTPFQILSNPAFSGFNPPRPLGEPGLNLWTRITGGYDISDAGGRELLLLACEATDRAVALRAIIDAEGMIVRTRTGLKDHPLLRHELANRALVSKLLVRLGLDMEASPTPPHTTPGRPPSGGIGVTDPEPFR
jgi:hypothetical protein